MIVTIVVDEYWWLRYVSSTSEVLNSWWNICLCHSIFECWVDDLHDLSTTNTSSSIRSGPITPCVEVSSCLSLLPDILLEFCISLKGLLAIFKYVLKNCWVPVFLNPIAASLSEFIVSSYCSSWVFFICSQVNADRREETVTVSFYSNEFSSFFIAPSKAVKSAVWPVSFICEPFLEDLLVLLSDETVWLIILIVLSVLNFVFIVLTKCKGLIVLLLFFSLFWEVVFIQFGILYASEGVLDAYHLLSSLKFYLLIICGSSLLLN